MSLVDRKLALRLIGIELAAVLVCSVGLAVYSMDSARSLLVGGMIAVLGHGYFAYKLFRFAGAQATRQILRGFYAGEAGKFLITIVLFAAVFKNMKDLQPAYLMTGFFLALVVQRLAPWWTKSSVQRN